MDIKSRFWIRFSLFNLFLVAGLGLLMRYKIGFEFPFISQKHIQFAHYHFAFYGWIGQALMSLMVHCIGKSNFELDRRKYDRVFSINMIASYGMLVSFLIWGFGPASVLFLLAAILAGYIFTVVFLRDLRRCEVNPIAANWFKAALFFNFLSTLGVFTLAYMMLGPHMHQNAYLATSYYYLHFQYNGWFFFACMGLFTDFINGNAPVYRAIFRWFFAACIPAYFLSVLWIDIPLWVYVLVVLSAVIQVYAWILQIMALVKTRPDALMRLPFILRYIILFVGVACSIKIVLQLGSTVPEVSKLAFGFRPIVIAYLHLVLLAMITLFLLFFIYANKLMSHSKLIMASLLVFSLGVFLNEMVLAVQGVAAFSYTLVPYANEILFAISILMVLGIASVATLSLIPKKNPKYDSSHK